MRTTPRPSVSIVTPLYNNAADLPTCLDSILSQTYENWNCAILNNCSSDGSDEIARRYAATDSRIRVHSNSSLLPPIANHNAALRLISRDSKYCKVVFADDWIFPECLERMVSVAEDHASVGIVGAYVLEGRDVTSVGLPYPSTMVSGRDICRLHLLDHVFVFGSANSLLYRSDLVRDRDPFFNENNIHADTEVCFGLLNNCDFGFVHQVLTATRVREGSLSKKSQELQTSLAGWLDVLVLHGRNFLTNAELDLLLKRHLALYYRFLGKSLFSKRSDEFWTYHRNKLIESGSGFSRIRLARGALEALGNALANPKDTVERLLSGRIGNFS